MPAASGRSSRQSLARCIAQTLPVRHWHGFMATSCMAAGKSLQGMLCMLSRSALALSTPAASCTAAGRGVRGMLQTPL